MAKKEMTKRERINAVLNHEEPDRLPIDFGATPQTGINASTLYKLREKLGLDQHRLYLTEVAQMLGYVEEDLRKLFETDVIGLYGRGHMLGGKMENFKPWDMPDGTPVFMPGDFEYDIDEKGTLWSYPGGDRTAQPSMVMPAGGSFFDGIYRTEGYDEDNLDGRKDFEADFQVMTDEDARYIEEKVNDLWNNTDYAIYGGLGGAGLGDASWLAAPHIPHPKGIRNLQDWYMAQLMEPQYIMDVFGLQTEVMLKNLEIYKQAVGEKICAVSISGTDFGTQNGPFMSIDTFRKLFKPYYTEINGWVHKNTGWKTWYHTCGSIVTYLDDFAEMGLDCLNPVQLKANGMDARMLKDKYGDKFVFWGGGVDTQHTLPYGTVDEVREEVKHNSAILGEGGGFVFGTCHNIVSNVPVENIITAFETALGHKIEK